MNEQLIEEVVAEVLRREEQPTALLLGKKPNRALGWRYVLSGTYHAVVIGSMSAGTLLQFPDEACTQALLEGKPVYVCEEGLEYRRYAKTANRALWSRLLAAERQMKQLGVQFLHSEGGQLLTAETVRHLKREGKPLPADCRLTPLARDIWEGRQ